MKLIKARPIQFGATLGIFSPSFPGAAKFSEKYEHGLREICRVGFKVKEGFLTQARASDGYRSASPSDRAKEFMELIEDPSVDALMSTIGGSNSASLIPYLDFHKIRESQKLIIGYSDVTSLHLAILFFSKLATLYGPAVVPSFGEYPEVPNYTLDSFLKAVGCRESYALELSAPQEWSNHFRNALTSEWKDIPRRYEENSGWTTLIEGEVEGPLVIANLSTLLSAAGTSYFPDLKGKILLVEEMEGPLSKEERNFRQLERIGIFDDIIGLIVGKIEFSNLEGASFGLNELILEIIESNRFPVVTNFDCGHTVPMLSLFQSTPIRLVAEKGRNARVTILSKMTDEE